MDLDLHLHSTASDGTVPPAEVVAAAVAARLDAIALTDHDTLAGISAATDAAVGKAVAVIPAIEMSTTHEGEELHILGYFVDPSDGGLLGHVERAGGRREARLREMVSRLNEQGVELAFERVAEAAGEGAPGRPHLARALVEAGVVGSVPEAFDRYIGNAHPAYVPTLLLDPREAIRLIHGAGGIAVWAHPPIHRIEPLLPGLRRWGLDGLEVYRPFLGRDRMLQTETAARSAGLIVTGGSDWHGPEGGPLGEFRVHASEVPRFLEIGGM
jgi:predicted metal-dependent phosphoesterase TrpH